jgi:hypothetical protein
MKAFRQFLAQNTTPEKRRELGVADLESFDYARHLAEQESPVGDAFARYQGGELKELFVRFQTEATVAFHRRTRKALDDHAGRHVPMSCNNGVRRWTSIEKEFDWVFGELSFGHARPQYLLEAMRTAAEHGRIQVVTMPKKGDRKDPEAWQRRTRQTIAMAYACGGLCMVPWDVYMPHDAPRYFGTPEQYADLFWFARHCVGDAFEEAAVAGPGVKETRYGENSPVVLEGGNGKVWAIVRAKPGDSKASVTIHLVDWGEQSKPCHVKLRTASFFGGKPLVAGLKVPQRKGADGGTVRHTPAIITGEFTVVEVPALNPWGILFVDCLHKPEASSK